MKAAGGPASAAAGGPTEGVSCLKPPDGLGDECRPGVTRVTHTVWYWQ